MMICSFKDYATAFGVGYVTCLVVIGVAAVMITLYRKRKKS